MMRKAIRWVFGALIIVGITALLVWAFLEGRTELAREREREKPVQVPPRVSRAAGGEIVVTLDRETQERIALTVEALAAVSRQPERTAYGIVLDPAPLAALDSERSSAEAAVAASKAEVERLRRLYQEGQNIPRKSLDLAEAQFRADDNRVRLAVQQIAAAWGTRVLMLAPAARQALIERLIRRETALVQVNLPAGEAMRMRPKAARVVVLGCEDRPLSTNLIFDAPTVDPKSQGQGFLLEVDVQGLPLRPGAAVTASVVVPAEPQHGVVIPRSAVVRFGGKAWAYVQSGEEQFSRREVTLTQATEQGWFMTDGFATGDRVVVTGAQLLLSEEFKSQIQIGEDQSR